MVRLYGYKLFLPLLLWLALVHVSLFLEVKTVPALGDLLVTVLDLEDRSAVWAKVFLSWWNPL